MSWTPTFWIKKTDFDRVKKKIANTKDKRDKEAPLNIYKFNIASNEGVAISCGEFTLPHEAVHDILRRSKIEHWLIDGEGHCGCKYGHAYGESIDKEAVKNGWD